MIYFDDPQNPGELQAVDPGNLAGYQWYAQAPAIQQGRLAAMANDPHHEWALADALNRARNTVVAAVDGMGPGEVDFLVAAYHLRDNLQVFDLVLQVQAVTAALNQANVPTAPMNMVPGSVTNFGQRVPETELLIPHPGSQWATLGIPGGLADCIARVLGANSVAYILTDNETQTASQSASLINRLQDVNNANLQTQGYTPLTWTNTAPHVETETTPTQTLSFTSLGGARMRIRHAGPHRLITVHRA